MAELTNLESKLAEVLGLAEASKGAAEKVKGMLDEDEQDLAGKLERMHEEAVETAERCIEVAGGFDGKKTAILEAARETKQEATEMMETYLEGEDDALDGFEFLTMAEAGEVGHWAIVKKLNERAGIASVKELGRLGAAGSRRAPQRRAEERTRSRRARRPARAGLTIAASYGASSRASARRSALMPAASVVACGSDVWR